MASRPTTIPQLDTSKTNRVAPVAGKIASGYALNDLFPSSNANYLHGWAGDWLEWLQERSEDGTTPGTDLSLRGLDALTTTSDGGTVTLTAGDGGSVSGDGGEIELYPGNQTSGNHGGVSIGAPRVTPWAQLEINGNAYQAGSDLLLVANGDNDSYAEIGLGSWDSGTEYSSWYLTAFGYQHATLAGKLRLNHARNIAGSTVSTPIFTVTNDDKIGFNITTPDTLVHLHQNSAGSVTALTGSVLTIENNSFAYISILTPDTDNRGIVFGETSHNAAGGIIYNDSAALDGMQFRVNGNQTVMTIDSGGQLGVGEGSPLGKAHIKTGDAGAISPSSNANELILEGSAACGMTIYSGSTSGGYIYFGDVDADATGGMYYIHSASSDKMFLLTAGSNAIAIDDSQNVGIYEPDPLGKLHIKTADAGSITPDVGADEFIIEGSGDAGMTIYTGTTSTGTIAFGASDLDNGGRIEYDQSSDEMKLYSGNGLALYTDINQAVWMPFVYSDDISAKTTRDLFIASDGQLGYDTSTIRKKLNITDMSDVSWIYQLRPVEFERKLSNGKSNGRREQGLIAEEVEKIRKDLVFYNQEDPHLVDGVHYRFLITPLVKALQQQREVIEGLSTRLQAANL
jgi:hypothetical protein